MSTLRPLKNNVMFQFLDDTGGQKGRFHHTTLSGIIVPPSVDNQKVHRWATVYAAGPDAAVVKGDYILIESLMWMEGTVFEGDKIWKTDDTKILAVTDDINDCQTQ
jgi:hypothetical protein